MQKPTQMITKHINLQITGDDDAVTATIKVLHRLNFINGSLWSQAVRRRGEASVMRVASRPIDVPIRPTVLSENELED